MPEVSIVMPAYNAEKYIREAMESVLAQTVQSWELIVIDGCSTDRTFELAKELAKSDERIRVFKNEKNSGAARSRNLGFEKCRGDYIALLDGDDLWHPDKLEKQLDLAKKTKADIVYCSYSLIDENGCDMCRDFIVPESIDYDEALVKSVMSCSTALLSKSMVDENKFQDDVCCEDLLYWLTALKNGKCACGLPEVLACCRAYPSPRASNKLSSAVNRWKIYRDKLNVPFFKRVEVFARCGLGFEKCFVKKNKRGEGSISVPEGMRNIAAHQAVMKEMLECIDELCRRYDIKYMLFAGTALGAVRHHGFIPWDDDLDIIMQRPDYERFLQIPQSEFKDKGYFLQGEFSEHWPMFFSKLRKNNTACIERFIPKDPKIHQGVYVDIFPCDNLSDSNFIAKLQYLSAKAVIANSLGRRGYLTDSVLKKLAIALSRMAPCKLLRRFALQRKAAKTKRVHCFFGASSKFEKSVFPREWFENAVYLKFEDGSYPVSEHYDALLTALYGDYMEPLPEDEREMKIHAELVDLENSYEKYIGIQEKMVFNEYTRSIR